jgi:hypothetical protein
MKFPVYPYLFAATLKSLDWTQTFISSEVLTLIRMKFIYLSSSKLDKFYLEFCDCLNNNILIRRLLLKHLFLMSYNISFTQNTFLRFHSNYFKYFLYTFEKDLPTGIVDRTLLRNHVYLTTLSINNLYILHSSQKID